MWNKLMHPIEDLKNNLKKDVENRRNKHAYVKLCIQYILLCDILKYSIMSYFLSLPDKDKLFSV